MHHLSPLSRRKTPIKERSGGCQDQVRFFGCFELNHMLHRLCGSPSIPLSFILANVLPRWTAYCVCCGTERLCLPTPSSHRLRRGLPGYLILFAPHAFRASTSVIVQQAAFATGVPPNIYAFHRYTRNSACLSDTLAAQFPKQSRG